MSRARRQPPAMIAGPEAPGAPAGGWSSDQRAVRVGVAPTTWLDGDPALSVAPPPEAGALPARTGGGPTAALPLVDGVPTDVRLERFDDIRGRLHVTENGVERRTPVLFGPLRRDRQRGSQVREMVVSGWRFEVEVEPEQRAILRERARRSAGAVSAGGPVEVRAIIPGRVVAVSVVPGDAVEAGQQILVVEAMKMQNELRAPREGTVERVGVAVGGTIEIGDLLVVIH